MIFANRTEAGRQLARHVGQIRESPDVIVLGVPRGGVPVAFEVAAALRAPLDIFVLRKLGVPWTGGIRVRGDWQRGRSRS